MDLVEIIFLSVWAFFNLLLIHFHIMVQENEIKERDRVLKEILKDQRMLGDRARKRG